MATDDAMMATVAGRYASALFELANEDGKLAEVESDLVKLQAVLDESGDFRQLVASPLYTTEEQVNAVSGIASELELGTLASNFLKMITSNRRLPALGDMIKGFRELAARSRGEVTAEVTSAVALSEDVLSDLRSTLKASVGKDVQLVTRVDPGLLGGLVVKIGSRMIDSSLRTKLDSMRMGLRSAG
ncbi:MAG: F0F1 ATP synthase subunit delta [Hyphomicrobiaceae bacterium]